MYGTERLEASRVRASLEAIYSTQRLGFKDRNFFLAPFWHTASSTEARLKSEHPEIAAVSIEAIFPKTLAVLVRERAQDILWCRAERAPLLTPDATSTQPLLIPAAGVEDIHGCAWIDREGIAFKPALPSEGALIVVAKDYRDVRLTPGIAATDRQLAHDILRVREISSETFGFPINTFALLPDMPADLVAYGPNGLRIILPRGEHFDKQLNNLGRFFQQEIRGDFSKIQEYVDARIENRVYYK